MKSNFPLLISFLLLLSISATAQLERGMRYLGNSSVNSLNINVPGAQVSGELGNLSYIRQEEDDLGVFVIAPQYGAFLADNLMLGAGLGFITLTNFEESNSLLQINPFARFYANPAAARTHFFGQAGLNFLALLGNDGDSNFGLDAGVGLTHFLAPGVGLDAFLAYSIQDLSTRGSGAFGLGAALKVYLGNEQRQHTRSAVSGIGRGSIMIGGTSGNLRIQDNDFGKRTDFDLSPKVMYFIQDRLALGAGLGLSFSRREFFTTFTQSNISINPQMRYYLSEGRHQQWFIGAGVEVGWENFNVEDFISGNSTFFGFGAGAGVNVFLTPGLAFEFGPSLALRSYSGDTANTNAFSLGVNAGLQFFINKNKE